MFSKKIEQNLNQTESLSCRVAETSDSMIKKPEHVLAKQKLAVFLKENDEVKGLSDYSKATRKYTKCIDRSMRSDDEYYGECNHLFFNMLLAKEYCLVENSSKENKKFEL